MPVTTRATLLKLLAKEDKTSFHDPTTSTRISTRKTTRKRKRLQPHPATICSKVETRSTLQLRSTVPKNESAFKVTTHPDSSEDSMNKWEQLAITVAGGNRNANQSSQLNHPHGIFIDDDQTIYIADYGNHRIVAWKCDATNGQIVTGRSRKGKKTNHLKGAIDVIVDKENNSLIVADYDNREVFRWSHQNPANGEIIISNINCFGLTMDKNGDLYVSDCRKHEVRRWKRGEKNGTIIAGGNGKGDRLNQFNCPTCVFVDEDYSLYVSDFYNHRVMKWIKDAEEGIVVAGGNGKGNNLMQLSSPRGVIVNQLGQIFVADSDNHRVMCWYKEAKQGTIVVGGNEQGYQSNQLNYPTGLSFDQQGHLYVADWENNRIQKFKLA